MARLFRCRAVVVALLIALCGCGISVTSSLSDHTGGIAVSQLKDNTLTLDLRTHPTRASFGMDDSSFAFYGSEDHPVRVLVHLPGRDVVFDRATVNAATGQPGGENGSHPEHQPTFFTVTVYYPDAAAARADTLAKAPDLHLGVADVETASVADPAESAPEDWRSYRLLYDEHSSDDPARTVDFFFDVDYYTNAAVEKIKHGSVVDLDLRTGPSRAALGFRSGYDEADVRPDPGRALTVNLRSSAGVGRFILGAGTEIASGTSTERAPTPSAGHGSPPRYTSITSCQDPARLQAMLLSAAEPLGLDRTTVAALPQRQSSAASPRPIRLTGRTSTFETTVDYSPGSDGLAGCARIRLSY